MELVIPFKMSCSDKRLRELAKEIDDQKNQLANNINQLDTQLAQTKNSYMKVLGAEELIKIQLDEHAAKEKVEEDSGDWDVKWDDKK